MFYTVKEKTEKKWTIDDVASQALIILKDKYKLEQVCTDMLKNYSESELLTTVRLNELKEDLIDDTLYYDGWKIGWKP